MQHHTYQFNLLNGNLSERKDLVKGLIETFEYDNLERLEEARASIVSTSVVTNLIETTYSANGNIESKTDAGIYAYDTQKKNAVVHVDNDLEQISFNTQEILYTPSAKSARITEGDKRMYFTYGAQDERIMTKLVELDNGNENILLKKYFVGLYEKEVEGTTERHVHYIMAGDGLTAIAIKEDEDPAETYFTYKDHLGSIVTLTDENGDVFFEQSFDAWGRYRNPNDWTYNNIIEPPTWLRGYTGHEHLVQFDLVNMNGRMYDPKLGRMLRPDNFVPDPLFTQAYNRYAYAYNNPLKFTDPDGELPVFAGMIIGAVIGGYIGGAVQSQNFNVFSRDYWENGWQGFIGGSVVGALTGGLAAKAGGGTGLAFMKQATAKKLSASMIAGTQNVLYQYDPERGFGWHSLGQFGAGFAGTYIGVSAGPYSSALSKGKTFVAFNIGGALNVAVNAFDYALNGKEMNGYNIAQWFVGGGLVAYGGAKMAGAGNYANKKFVFGPLIDKQLDYGIQALASDFAYDKDQAFFQKSLGHHFGTFAGGFLSGSMQFASEYNSLTYKTPSQNSRRLYGVAFFGASYSIDYMYYGFMKATQKDYNFYAGGAQQKAGLFSSKLLFNFLTIK